MWSAASFETSFWGSIGTRFNRVCNSIMRGLVLGARLLFHVFLTGDTSRFQMVSEAQVFLNFVSECNQILLMVTSRSVPSSRT